ncbi:MAG: hypothetical protein JJ843_09575 [Prochlorococcus marinus CUG1434]|nr:hypothetical protein [Prochlorococcus marinus CUG1434]
MNSASSLTDFQALNYIASNPDLIAAFGINISSAISHYDNHGRLEGRSITTFNASGYLAKYSDLSSAFGRDKTLALKHYIQNGYGEGRTASKYLLIDENIFGDIVFYEGDTVIFELEATRYYRHWSDLNYHLPGENITLFRNAFSSLTRFDFLGAPESLFNYTTIESDGYARWEYTFLDDGIEEGPEDMAISRSASPHGGISFNLVIDDRSNLPSVSLTDFQALNYIASNPDLISAFGINITSAISHYDNYGRLEGRSITTFSASGYLATYSDLSSAFGNDQTLALKHYIQSGYSEGRTVSSSGSNSGYGAGSTSTSTSTSTSSSGSSSPTALSDFQALNYIASNIDLISVFGINIEAAKSHYINYGRAEGRPVDNFDEWGYLASNNDLMSALGSNTTEVIKHFISFGKSEGRSTTIFNAQSYLNNYADLRSAFGNDQTLAAKHFVESGFSEGRFF